MKSWAPEGFLDLGFLEDVQIDAFTQTSEHLSKAKSKLKQRACVPSQFFESVALSFKRCDPSRLGLRS